MKEFDPHGQEFARLWEPVKGRKKYKRLPLVLPGGALAVAGMSLLTLGVLYTKLPPPTEHVYYESPGYVQQLPPKSEPPLSRYLARRSASACARA